MKSSALTDILPLWQVEKAAIESAIAICDGNIPKAAALLDVSPSTIYRKQKNWA
jgi:two-component system repressor protein LuxO